MITLGLRRLTQGRNYFLIEGFSWRPIARRGGTLTRMDLLEQAAESAYDKSHGYKSLASSYSFLV